MSWKSYWFSKYRNCFLEAYILSQKHKQETYTEEQNTRKRFDVGEVEFNHCTTENAFALKPKEEQSSMSLSTVRCDCDFQTKKIPRKPN